MNAIGAIIDFVFVAVGLFNGSINSDVFYAWLTSTLLPNLQAGTVIVMDNASFHKSLKTKEILAAHGHELEFLPPYSPDFNPIEHKSAQLKAIRRKYNCSTLELFQKYSLQLFYSYLAIEEYKYPSLMLKPVCLAYLQ